MLSYVSNTSVSLIFLKYINSYIYIYILHPCLYVCVCDVVCVFSWGCVCHEASMCEGIYVFNIIHRHIGRQHKTRQINQKTWHLYTSAAITTVTRASVTIAGAHAHDDVACFEYIAWPPPHTRTHTGTRIATIGERCSINLLLCCLCPDPSLLSAMFVSECAHPWVCVREC